MGHGVQQVYHTHMLCHYACVGTDLERQMATAKLCAEPFLPLSKKTLQRNEPFGLIAATLSYGKGTSDIQQFPMNFLANPNMPIHHGTKGPKQIAPLTSTTGPQC